MLYNKHNLYKHNNIEVPDCSLGSPRLVTSNNHSSQSITLVYSSLMMQSDFRRIVEEELATRQLLEVEDDRANEVESNY